MNLAVLIRVSPLIQDTGLFPPKELRESQLAALRAMQHYVSWTPKFHQWMHMCRPSGQNGGARCQSYFQCVNEGPGAEQTDHILLPRRGENPSFHSCWLNESDNKRIMRIAASCHRRVFEMRVLSSWALVQQEGWHKAF